MANNDQPVQKPDTSGREVDIRDNVIGGSPAGGVAGTGGVSTNDVGISRTKKSPLVER